MISPLKRLSAPPQLTRSDWIWTLAPLTIGLLAVYYRQIGIQLHCPANPTHCTAANVLSMDRPAIGLSAQGSDALSFVTQDLAGFLALGVPLVLHLWRLMKKKILGKQFAALLITDWVISVQIAAWNFFLSELAHWLSSRPRPFVFLDPLSATRTSNYTSFYSGHTSFAASATLGTLLMLWGRNTSSLVLAVYLAVCYSITSLTGMYRVMAGRHFPTDVTIGALAGFAVAYWISSRHRSN